MSDPRHPLLLRQLLKAGLHPGMAPDADAWRAFLASVDAAYHESDQDRYTLERSLMLSSQEMQELYEDLRSRSETELERSHRELEASLAVSRATIESSPDGILVVDEQRRIVSCNRRFVEMWSLPESLVDARDSVAVLEHVRVQLVDPDGFIARVRQLDECSRDSFHDELWFKDGRIFDRHSAPVSSAPGTVRGRVVTFRDVTERRRAEETIRRLNAELEQRVEWVEQALTASEQRFARLAEAGIIGMFSYDDDGSITDANDAFLRIVGYTRADFAAGVVTPAALAVPAWAQVDRRVRKALETAGATETWEKELRRKDGSPVPVLIGATRLDDGGGVACIIDLSDKKRSEAALVESQTRLRALSDSGIIGITIADRLGNILDANDAFLRIVGYTRADVEAGQVRWADMTPADWMHVNAGIGAQLRSRGYTDPHEKEYLRKDGTRVPVLVGTAAIDSTRAISFCTDLSERKCAEAALARAEAQLRQAQKMDAVGRLAGGVAHDFNNLLSIILSYAELVGGELYEGDPLRESIDEIAKAARRAGELTRQLLLFSRQEVVESRVIDLDCLIADMHKMLGRLVGEHIELVWVPGGGSRFVRADPGHVEQVLMNLVVNARDAMPGGGRLTIETSRSAVDEREAGDLGVVNSGDYVVLAVSDTGCGMDAVTQSRMFEPFFTTKEAGRGTGLGLATVFGIVRQNGGGIGVSSAPGRGSTFRIHLPAVAEPAVSSAPARGAAQRGDGTILLVEDDGAVRRVVRAILQRQGYQVIEACDGAQALRLAEAASAPIDLLVTDVIMPKMSGPELARRLCEARPGLPVLCMSGYTDDLIARHSLAEHTFAFLQKPIAPDMLVQKVREALGSSRAGTPAQPRRDEPAAGARARRRHTY